MVGWSMGLLDHTGNNAELNNPKNVRCSSHAVFCDARYSAMRHYGTDPNHDEGSDGLPSGGSSKWVSFLQTRSNLSSVFEKIVTVLVDSLEFLAVLVDSLDLITVDTPHSWEVASARMKNPSRAKDE